MPCVESQICEHMTSATGSEPNQLNGLIDAAASRGIIDARQREQLQALAAELASVPASAHAPAVAASSAMPPEARRGFNAITVAYSLGALLVLFALAWFLVERWKALGASGVLIVAVLYAAAFAVVGVLLRRRGFMTAGGIAITLAVMMTPVWSWAMLVLAGEAPDPLAWDQALARYAPFEASRFIIYELATIGVALATVRHVRFFGIGAPIAVAFVALLMHLGQALGDPRLTWYIGPYYQCAVACATLAVAYAVERRQPAGEDYAFWFYLAGVGMLVIGYASVWSHIGAWRHALPLVATAFVIASLYLRRRTLLIAGGVFAFAYLGYLAFDVFRRVVALPIALAALGLLVIGATVWMQRRFPALVERVSRSDDSGRKALPAGPVFVVGPFVIAATVTMFAAGDARERTAEQDWRRAIYQKRAKHDATIRRSPAAVPLPPPRASGNSGPRK
jgi:hypothetical protein